MKLNISYDDKYYKADAIKHGRNIGKFIRDLSTSVFYQSYRYWKEYKFVTGYGEIPILEGERNIYSTFAVSINKITPIHMSEVAFNQSDYDVKIKNRRVDFWCFNKKVNYFIEIKKGEYNINETTYSDFDKVVLNGIDSLVDQITTIKKVDSRWLDFDDIILGIYVIHGSYVDGKECYDETDVRENIYDKIKTIKNCQLMITTWNLPKTMEVQWENRKCKFITIAGIVTTIKKTIN